MHGTARQFALGHNHDTAVLRFAEAILDELFQLVHLSGKFWNDGCLATSSNSTVQCQETCIASHYLHKEQALMTGSGITNLIDALKDGVQCGVITNGRVGTIQVVVDGARQTDTRHIELLGKLQGTCQRAVTANHHQSVDAFFLHVFIGCLASLGSTELLAASSLQDRTSQLDDVTHVLTLEFNNLACHQTFITSIDTFYLQSVIDGATGHRTDGCIHARGITA